jgi:hypothetical protein
VPDDEVTAIAHGIAERLFGFDLSAELIQRTAQP